MRRFPGLLAKGAFSWLRSAARRSAVPAAAIVVIGLAAHGAFGPTRPVSRAEVQPPVDQSSSGSAAIPRVVGQFAVVFGPGNRVSLDGSPWGAFPPPDHQDGQGARQGTHEGDEAQRLGKIDQPTRSAAILPPPRPDSRDGDRTRADLSRGEPKRLGGASAETTPDRRRMPQGLSRDNLAELTVRAPQSERTRIFGIPLPRIRL